MAQPGFSTVTIDGNKFDAFSTEVGIETLHDEYGMPLMGTLASTINVAVDIHDTVNMPFGSLTKLFALANGVTRDKIVDIKIEYWADENKQDAICVYSFRGWVAKFHTTSHGGGNHVLQLHLQPELDQKQFINIQLSN